MTRFAAAAFFFAFFSPFSTRTFLHPGPRTGRNEPTGKSFPRVGVFDFLKYAHTHARSFTPTSPAHKKLKILLKLRTGWLGGPQYGVPPTKTQLWPALAAAAAGGETPQHTHTHTHERPAYLSNFDVFSADEPQ